MAPEVNKDPEPVQSLWIGERLSVMEQLVVRSFLRTGHPFHLYVYDEVRDVPNGCTVLDASSVLARERVFTYPGLATYAGFSDLFRFKLLLEQGGTWVDMDVVCLQPFRFDAKYVFGLESSGYLASCVIRSPPGSPLLKSCFDAADAIDPSRAYWGQAGPGLLTRLVRELGLWDFVLAESAFCPVHYSQFRALVEKDAATLLPSDNRPVYGLHLWNEMWRREGLDKDADYPGHCCYEQLKALLLGEQ